MKAPMTKALSVVVILAAALALSGSALADRYVQVSPDLVIHYQESGSGQPVVFIPGWTGSTGAFQYQLEHFSQNYRAITFDPRSHGLSSKTLENNTYLQHGHDLKAFLDALELENVILAGHSSGCLDIWSYVRAAGTDNIRAVIAIDCIQPKLIRTQDSDAAWALIVEAKDWMGITNAVTYHRRDIMPGFLQSMFVREPSADALAAMLAAAMQTPDYAATALWSDATFRDYTEEAKLVDGSVPSLWVLPELNGEPEPDSLTNELKVAGISQDLPNSLVVVSPGKHFLHVEFPDEFNAAVEAFLEDLPE